MRSSSAPGSVFPRIQAALKCGKTAPSLATPALDKKRAVLQHKTALTPSIWKLQFRTILVRIGAIHLYVEAY